MVKPGYMASEQFERPAAIKMRGRSIGERISALVGLAVILAVGLVTAITAFNDVTSDFVNRKRALEATGYVFASALADHVVNHNTQESLRVLRSISRLPEISYAAVLDKDGKAFASFGSAVILQSAALKSDIGILEALRNGTYPVAADIIKASQRVGQIVLIADVSDLRRQLLNALLTSLAVALGAIAVSFAVARRLQSRITGPILSLTAAIQDIRDTKRYQGSAIAKADGETGLLVDSFNAMIEEVRSRDAALEKHRQTLESTVEQRTHELRLARDQAESANAAKSSFLATMSHEIRTPLNGLMVMAELLEGAGLDQRLQRYAEVIVKSGRSLLTVINDILDLSKIEAGKLQLEIIPVCPAGIADDVTSLFWERASSKNLDLASRMAPGMPLAVLADPVRLNQILSNLVNNALKFTERGQVLISMQYDAGHLVMAVTDSGIGIPQKKLDILFEAFSQADQTITRKFGGSGLGLAICKRLAEAMGGTIGVKSELGKGSTFWVRLPLRIAKPALPPVPAQLTATIAVDGRATQSSLGTHLAGAGFGVSIIAAGVPQADIVFATTGRLKDLVFPSGHRPRIICLSWIGDSDGDRAITEGRADDLMILPLRQSDIADMITRIHTGTLRGKAVLDRHVAGKRPLASFKGRHVMVADDNAVNREVIIEVLRQIDVSVDVAVNGREAVDLWKQKPPDLIFMDCSMPEMDGYAATREIRAHEALAIAGGHTPIVALTAHVAGDEADQWRHAGMDAYLTKPFTLKQIVASLETLLAGRPMADVTEVALPGDAVILDAGVIAELRNIGGSSALFHRVLDLFAGRVPQAVESVSALSESGDAKALADAAHALKSMCANIGAFRAVDACHALERAARSGEDFDPGQSVASIIHEVRLVMTEVQKLRKAG